MLEHPEATDFVAYLHLKNLAPATIRNYRGVLKRLFDPIDLGPSPPSQITAAQLRDYVASLYERELAPKTIRNYALVMKRFFRFPAGRRVYQGISSLGEMIRTTSDDTTWGEG